MNLFFWKKWNKPYSNFYIFLFSIFLLSLAGLLTTEILGNSVVIGWETIPALDSVKVVLDSFSQYLLTFSVEADAYLLNEKFQGADVKIYPVFSYAFLGLVLLGILTCLTLITYMDLSWYIIGMILLMLYFASMQMELLKAFGRSDHLVLASVIVAYSALSYYFQAFNKNVSFFSRLGLFVLLTCGAGITLSLTAQTEVPLLYLANFSIGIPLVLSVLFFLFISFDIIKAFLYITTDSANTTGKNNLLSFSSISILYLINILLLYLRKSNLIDWDILYFNAFYIYIVAAILGIWSYKKRSVLFKDVIPFAPNGAYFYLALGIIASSTIAFAFITGNDPLVESLEYFIIYTQLAFGSIFFIYVIVNYYDIFNKIPVYKAVYKPRRMPFFMVRGVGFIIAMALFLYNSKSGYYLALSGYYNLVGDVFKHEGENTLARHYYHEGMVYHHPNHRSNYSSAKLAEAAGKNNKAIEYYERANIKKPMPHAFVNLSNLYHREDMYFPALFKLQYGIKHFPKSAELNNNLGILYKKTDIADSVVHHLQLSRANTNKIVTPLSNHLSFYLKQRNVVAADSISRDSKEVNGLIWENNNLALRTSQGKVSEKVFNTGYFSDSTLQNTNFSYLYNFGLNKFNSTDTSFFSLYRKLISHPENEVYLEDLNLIKGLRMWYNGDKAEAKNMLDLIAGQDFVSNPTVSRMVANLLIREKAYKAAANYFRKLSTKDGQAAYMKYLLCEVLAGETEEAIEGFSKLKESKDPNIAELSGNIHLILTTDTPSEVLDWEESLRYQYLAFRKQDLSETDILSIYSSIKDTFIKQMSTAILMSVYIENENPQKALDLYNQLTEEEKENTELNLQYLRTLVYLKEVEKLANIYATIDLERENEDFRIFLEGFVAQHQDQKDEAEKAFSKAVERMPFNEEVIIHAADFFNAENERLTAYEALLRSVRLMPEQTNLLKAYALQSIRMNLSTYAASTLKDLEYLLSEEEYRQFEKIYNKELEQQED
ncbi:hypothetical protein RCC89_20925 [Cytophagaceae bacterium ABcell3]|nr:hypothetical protein RCC89_20925 [Cytophagaceae bacterium ABcell3]